jgi:diguanylate cyclase (GGDEF)-like protein
VTKTKSKSTNGHRPLVLVVDDDPDLRTLAKMQLTPDYDVIQAANGRECVQAAKEHAPDVILLDIMMPEMDGREVLTALSSDKNTKDIPVIFLSALNALNDRVDGLDSGATDYITKPVDGRELLARVGVAARTFAKQQEIKANATADSITKLPSRKAFDARLREEVARSQRSSAPLSVLLIDIDQMDAINDEHGAEFGDRLLAELGQALRTTLRTSDALFRYGGDEFAAILPDSDVPTAYLAAERCRRGIEEVPLEGATVRVSIGIAEFSAGRSSDELVAKAEIALFRAKESGGNRSWRADDPRRHGLNPVSLSDDLTEREWDVLVHLAHRRTEHDIGRRLGISAGTVRSHKARIRRKLHVSPDIRLSDFVRSNFRDLVNRIEVSRESGGAEQ